MTQNKLLDYVTLEISDVREIRIEWYLLGDSYLVVIDKQFDKKISTRISGVNTASNTGNRDHVLNDLITVLQYVKMEIEKHNDPRG